MTIFQKIKNYFRSAFREIIVYHNSSLEFRAKLFAIVAGASQQMTPEDEQIIMNAALDIYNDDENRAMTLWLATQEYYEKIKEDNNLGVDELAKDIMKLLKRNHRFVHKINTDYLMPLVHAQPDQDTRDYQIHIIDFLDTLKKEAIKEMELKHKYKQTVPTP